jgi:hypothetical protein
MLASFFVILWGVSLSIAKPDSIKASYLAAISGIITEFIGVNRRHIHGDLSVHDGPGKPVYGNS